MRGGARWAGVAVGVVLTCAACGGSPKAAPVPTSSPVPLVVHTSAEDSATAVPATPTLDPNSDAAILAAVDAYVAAIGAVGRTASVAPLAGIVDRTCPCRQTLEILADSLRDAGQHADAVITPTLTRILRRSTDHADVSVKISNAPYDVLDSHNNVVGRAPSATQNSVVSVQLEGSQWLVFFVQAA